VWNWMIRTLVAEHDRKWLGNLGFLRLSPQSSHWNQTMSVLVLRLLWYLAGSVLRLAGVNLIWAWRLPQRPQEWECELLGFSVAPFTFIVALPIYHGAKIRNFYFFFFYFLTKKVFIFKKKKKNWFAHIKFLNYWLAGENYWL
jgi:hypothetical protein